VALVDAGRAGEALDDIIEAVGEARSRDADTAEQNYHLVLAYRSAGRVEDLVQTADDIAAWLDRLRERGKLDNPDMADLNRILLAEGYAALGDDALALEEYEKLATAGAERPNLQLVLLAQTEAAGILDRLDRDAEAAQAYRIAGDAAEKLGNAHGLAACRAGEALSLHWAGDRERALAMVVEADRATRKVPGKPAAQLATSRAITSRCAANVLVGAGRFQEATDRAAQAAEAFRQVGNAGEAVKMDLLRARIIGRDSPALAVPVLQAALAESANSPTIRRLVERALAATLEDLGRTDEAERLRANLTATKTPHMQDR
jgi:hypothetical protein